VARGNCFPLLRHSASFIDIFMASYLAKLIKNLEYGMNRKHKLKAKYFTIATSEARTRQTKEIAAKREEKTFCKQPRAVKRILIQSFLLQQRFYEFVFEIKT
jgi:hypothetical protein